MGTYDTWDWRQIENAILGTYGPDYAGTVTPSVSDPLSISGAGARFAQTGMDLENLNVEVTRMIEQLTGHSGIWQGPGAEDFRATMFELVGRIQQRADPILGNGVGHGTTPYAVTMQRMSDALANAIIEIRRIDSEVAVEGAARYNSAPLEPGTTRTPMPAQAGMSIVPIDQYPELVEQLNTRMRAVITQLATTYDDAAAALSPIARTAYPVPGASTDPALRTDLPGGPVPIAPLAPDLGNLTDHHVDSLSLSAPAPPGAGPVPHLDVPGPPPVAHLAVHLPSAPSSDLPTPAGLPVGGGPNPPLDVPVKTVDGYDSLFHGVGALPNSLASAIEHPLDLSPEVPAMGTLALTGGYGEVLSGNEAQRVQSARLAELRGVMAEERVVAPGLLSRLEVGSPGFRTVTTVGGKLAVGEELAASRYRTELAHGPYGPHLPGTPGMPLAPAPHGELPYKCGESRTGEKRIKLTEDSEVWGAHPKGRTAVAGEVEEYAGPRFGPDPARRTASSVEGEVVQPVRRDTEESRTSQGDDTRGESSQWLDDQPEDLLHPRRR
ncbi:hypothetical protein [Kitasatospora sp. NPDC093102]|uniref:hypothetical protein n=1 Tax=Kitasatospora sp. NPDC093102 TaxID=3155069 RepID=UPI0034477012